MYLFLFCARTRAGEICRLGDARDARRGGEDGSSLLGCFRESDVRQITFENTRNGEEKSRWHRLK